MDMMTKLTDSTHTAFDDCIYSLKPLESIEPFLKARIHTFSHAEIIELLSALMFAEAQTAKTPGCVPDNASRKFSDLTIDDRASYAYVVKVLATADLQHRIENRTVTEWFSLYSAKELVADIKNVFPDSLILTDWHDIDRLERDFCVNIHSNSPIAVFPAAFSTSTGLLTAGGYFIIQDHLTVDDELSAATYHVSLNVSDKPQYLTCDTLYNKQFLEALLESGFDTQVHLDKLAADALPFDQGREAYLQRIHPDDNPYSVTDWRHSEWNEGWDFSEEGDSDSAFDYASNKFIK
ncbi:TPA: hypothetical protein KDZ08_004811 [Vibrio parahaemolyticus]|uniref:hypothetical protein n=1 Tax=Vibrio TaxID=662 RepID=UPI001B8397B8|nr:MULTISPECIES: hypothetical protein [Vibrio]BDP38552.1 hypothetical protein VA208B3_49230 [Vibrio alginolyticus]MCR9820090.1 hypothetical protein [Vibrio parahaemolyticus]BDP33559.1 hypothetical protein VV208B2_46390 [Vibrio vulnificus]HBC3540197.1 hypothetical protein [Vibrio parahaemolyticus]HBC3592910.1 hypothetical protein [Vibrio parahaemolyticus]